MRQYTLIHNSILDTVVAALPNETGEMVTTTLRDPIYETRDVLDDDGQPIGETYDVFIGLDDPYETEVPEVQGGYCTLGYYEDFIYILTAGNNATHVQLENAHDDLFVPLMKWPDAETFEDRKTTRIATAVRSKVNIWRESFNLEPYPSDILNGEVLQDTLKLCGKDFDIIAFSIMASKD